MSTLCLGPTSRALPSSKDACGGLGTCWKVPVTATAGVALAGPPGHGQEDAGGWDLRQPPCQKWSGAAGGGRARRTGSRWQGELPEEAASARGPPRGRAVGASVLAAQAPGRFCTLCLAGDQRVASSSSLVGVCVS